MEMIKCEKCGQVMGAASEACPVCGTPVAQNMTVQTFLNENKAFRGLVEALQENLTLQAKKPKSIIETTLDISKFMDEDDNIKEGYDEDVVYNLMNVPVTNCLFKEHNGAETFRGSMNDGLSHLMMQFFVTEGTEEFDKFKGLDISSQFVYDKSGKIHAYSIDCGSNAEFAAEVYTKVLMTAFGADYDLYDTFMTVEGMSKKDAQKQAKK